MSEGGGSTRSADHDLHSEVGAAVIFSTIPHRHGLSLAASARTCLPLRAPVRYVSGLFHPRVARLAHLPHAFASCVDIGLVYEVGEEETVEEFIRNLKSGSNCRELCARAGKKSSLQSIKVFAGSICNSLHPASLSLSVSLPLAPDSLAGSGLGESEEPPKKSATSMYICVCSLCGSTHNRRLAHIRPCLPNT